MGQIVSSVSYFNVSTNQQIILFVFFSKADDAKNLIEFAKGVNAGGAEFRILQELELERGRDFGQMERRGRGGGRGGGGGRFGGRGGGRGGGRYNDRNNYGGGSRYGGDRNGGGRGGRGNGRFNRDYRGSSGPRSYGGRGGGGGRRPMGDSQDSW